MLSAEDNELLTRVGPGTAMGNLLRQYWLPGLPSENLPTPDCPPKRVRLLGEDLVAFRTTSGEVGMVQDACPHRGASLFFGRNEEEGLRCVYHGWKFDVGGACVDMPNEPAESNFKHKIRATAYPCRDVNGMIWVYMGPRTTPPPLPALEFNTASPEEVFRPSLMFEENNWVQGLEGDIDSSHIDYLHARLRTDGTAAQGHLSADRAPRLEVLSTDYGAAYAARRNRDDQGNLWYRISQFIMPFYTMIAATSGDRLSARAWVPLDDTNTLLTNMPFSLQGPVPADQRNRPGPESMVGGYLPETGQALSRYRYPANAANNYLLDYGSQRDTMFSGIPRAGNLQDIAMTESMGAVLDRTVEHLGSSDTMIIFVRRLLIRSAKALRDEGIVPATVDNPKLYRVRSAGVVLPPGASWIEATEKARYTDNGVPIAYVENQ